MLSICNFTWCVVGHAWYQLQIHRTDTRSWSEAQLQQEVVGVLTLSCNYTVKKKKKNNSMNEKELSGRDKSREGPTLH